MSPSVQSAVDANIVESINTGHISLTVVVIGLLVVIWFLYKKLEDERKEYRLDKKEIREYFSETIQSVTKTLSEQNESEHNAMRADIKGLSDGLSKMQVELGRMDEKLSSVKDMIQNGK